MKVEDIYRIIPCEKRLPKDDGWYLTDMGERAQYEEIDGEWYDLNYNKFRPTYWLEKQSRIVLTKEEYKKELVEFANFCEKKKWENRSPVVPERIIEEYLEGRE